MEYACCLAGLCTYYVVFTVTTQDCQSSMCKPTHNSRTWIKSIRSIQLHACLPAFVLRCECDCSCTVSGGLSICLTAVFVGYAPPGSARGPLFETSSVSSTHALPALAALLVSCGHSHNTNAFIKVTLFETPELLECKNFRMVASCSALLAVGILVSGEGSGSSCSQHLRRTAGGIQTGTLRSWNQMCTAQARLWPGLRTLAS